MSSSTNSDSRVESSSGSATRKRPLEDASQEESLIDTKKANSSAAKSSSTELCGNDDADATSNRRPGCTNVLQTTGEVCGRTESLNKELQEHFDLCVCTQCCVDYPEQYSLVTKAEAKATYLLTEDTFSFILKDRCVTRDNPRNRLWTPMKLYLRGDVARLGAERHGGSAQGLEEERNRRQAAKFDRQLAEVTSVFSTGAAAGAGAVPASSSSSSSATGSMATATATAPAAKKKAKKVPLHKTQAFKDMMARVGGQGQGQGQDTENGARKGGGGSSSRR